MNTRVRWGEVRVSAFSMVCAFLGAVANAPAVPWCVHVVLCYSPADWLPARALPQWLRREAAIFPETPLPDQSYSPVPGVVGTVSRAFRRRYESMHLLAWQSEVLQSYWQGSA